MSKVKVPRRLKARPKWKGLPIPYIALIRDDGTPDFRVTNELARREVISNHRCQLCGEPLGKWFFFTGGPAAAAQNAYFEPACHLDCLVYAMQVCPFIVGKMEHADLAKVQADNPDVTVAVDETYTSVKSEAWVITKSNGWRVIRTKGGTFLIQPHVLKRTGLLYPQKMTAADWDKVKEELL